MENKVEEIVQNFENHFTEQYAENDWKRLKCVRVQEPLNWLRENIYDALTQQKKEIDKYREALIWCSGSEDFQVGGKAREGWEKLCKPLLDNLN